MRRIIKGCLLLVVFLVVIGAQLTIYFNVVEHKVVQMRNPITPVHHTVRLDGETYDLYWGDLHGHSGLSPDALFFSPDHYYEYGRDVAKLDFAALTDHDAPWGLYGYPARWQMVRDAAKRHNDPGRFVAILAFEWTSGSGLDTMLHTLRRGERYAYQEDPRHFGHRNVYFPGDEAPEDVFSNDQPHADTPEKLWGLMREYGALSIPHHPLGGPTFPFKWDHYDEEMEPVVEIYSYHGNSECEDCPHTIYNPYLTGRHDVRHGLELGNHFGFIASTDCHQGRAGNYTYRYWLLDFVRWFYRGKPVPGQGTAAVYAKELTREGIFEALRSRRTYATTGARIVLEVRANGHFMGEAFDADGPVELEIRAMGLREIRKVEIIRNGRVVKKFEGTGVEFAATFVDEEAGEGEDYYYVRVWQADGHLAWSSPVWARRGGDLRVENTKESAEGG